MRPDRRNRVDYRTSIRLIALYASLDSAMRYYFDLEADGASTTDHDGTECQSFDDMRRLSMHFLAEVARDSAETDYGLVLRTTVRDAMGIAVYEATLTLSGHSL
jgi:hypothetical protein